MKNLSLNFLVVLCFAVSCTDRQAATNSNLEVAKILNPQVGGPVPVTSAQAWTNEYNNRYPSQEIPKSFFADGAIVKEMLGLINNGKPVDGFSFVKGLNESGEETMMVVPVQDGKMLYAASKTIYELNVNQIGQPLSISSAKTYASNYANHYPSNEIPKSYFVGREAITEILTLTNGGKSVDGIRVVKAIKDNGQETLVLIATQSGNDLWRLSKSGSRTEEGTGGTYDFSAPCPPTCP